MTRLELRVVLLPYAVVKPYCTWVSAISLVIHDMAAPLVVMLEVDIEERAGGVVSEVVVIGRLHEAVVPPLEPVQLHR